MNQDIEKEITELEKMHEIVNQESLAVSEAKIESPVATVENSLASFVQNAFDVTSKDFEFSSALQQSLLQDLDDPEKMSTNQKIALYSTVAVNNNDKMSKLLSPIMQLMTTRQQAEMQAAAQIANHKIDVQVDQKEADLNKNVTTEVLQGMSALKDFMTMFQKTQSEPSSE